MTPTEVAAKLRAFNEWRRCGDIKYPGPLAVDETIDAAIETIERMREWIHDEGERNNVCTYNILGTVCGYCECQRKKESK